MCETRAIISLHTGEVHRHAVGFADSIDDIPALGIGEGRHVGEKLAGRLVAAARQLSLELQVPIFRDLIGDEAPQRGFIDCVIGCSIICVVILV